MAPRKHRRRKRHKDGDETPNEATVTQLPVPVETPGPEATEERETGSIKFEDRLSDCETTSGILNLTFSPTDTFEQDLPDILRTITGIAICLQGPSIEPDRPDTITFHTGLHDMTILSDLTRRAMQAVAKLPLVGKYLAVATTEQWTEPLRVNFTRHHKGGFIDEDGIEDADWTEVHQTTIHKNGVSRANIVKVINRIVDGGGHITQDAILVEVFAENDKVLTLQVDERGYVYE